MPKIINTRRQRALELKKRLENGPSFSEPFRIDDSWDHPERGYAAQYRLWAESWVLPALNDLVPELKPKP